MHDKRDSWEQSCSFLNLPHKHPRRHWTCRLLSSLEVEFTFDTKFKAEVSPVSDSPTFCQSQSNPLKMVDLLQLIVSLINYTIC